MLDALRRATSSLHAETENHPLVSPLLASDPTAQQVAWLLCGFREFYALLEPALSSRVPADLAATGYRYHPRLPLLKADIADLVGDAPVPPGLCRDLAFLCPGNPVGILYVVEGATQGGRVIAPALASSLGTGAHRGARFFHLYTRGQWPLLRGFLASRGSDGCDEILLAGCATFRLLHRVLDRVYRMRQGYEKAG
ncbi:MAG: biliverdin-producing heme oxygenase [Halioglobus sp.]|nr:biliverdin-producing heme oxygenase [Halioglobus sp.]